MSAPIDIDLDAYLARIDWRAGEARADYATLAALVHAHMASVPFENLDVLLGRGIRLDLASLSDKLVRARRGGYCFEQSTLFAAVLRRIGFAPVAHSARVVLRERRDTAARTHMFLVVPLPEGSFVVDVGFGALAPQVPVRLDRADAQPAAATDHWIAHEDGLVVLRARTADGNVDCWVSPLDRVNPIDFEVANHYTSTHPDSPFVNRLMLRASTPQARVSVMNRDVTIQRDGAAPETYVLRDRLALRALLAERFGFDLPDVLALRVPSVPGWN